MIESGCKLFVKAINRDVRVAERLHSLCHQCSHYLVDEQCCAAPPDMLAAAEREAKMQNMQQ